MMRPSPSAASSSGGGDAKLGSGIGWIRSGEGLAPSTASTASGGTSDAAPARATIQRRSVGSDCQPARESLRPDASRTRRAASGMYVRASSIDSNAKTTVPTLPRSTIDRENGMQPSDARRKELAHGASLRTDE